MTDQPLQSYAVGDRIIVDQDTRTRGRVVTVHRVAKVNPKTVVVNPWGDDREIRYHRSGETVFGTGWDRNIVKSFPDTDPRAAEALAYRELWKAKLTARAAARAIDKDGINPTNAHEMSIAIQDFTDAHARYATVSPDTFKAKTWLD